MSRWWQSFNTRYNVYFNGEQAFIEGQQAKEEGNKDNLTELIPLYYVGNKNSRTLGQSQFDRTVEKMEKAIKLHSIRKRPTWNSNRRKTAADVEWLNRKEYNPFLWKAWLLMGQAQFQKGAFDEAASTFAFMSRIYAKQPAIHDRARAWLARTYVENGMLYDAEDVIRGIERDTMHWRTAKEWDYTYADYYLRLPDYDKAVVYLRRVVKHEKRRRLRARQYFLLGQVEALRGKAAEAVRAYKKCIRMNPPYELEFNARIAMTEVMARSNGKGMMKKLKRMAASETNTEYLDQVYYAMGNVLLADRDTLGAIAAYEKGVEKGTRQGVERGVLLARLADLYWQKENWSGAARCYGQAVGLLDHDRKDFETLNRRSTLLDELVPFTSAVQVQDSLQNLARMDEKQRNAVIDRAIEAYKKKEREERRNEAEAQRQAQGGMEDNLRRPQTNVPQTSNSTFYFYNPMTVQQGRAQFEKIWGKRANVDDWQRVNKTVVAGLGTAQTAGGATAADSAATAAANNETAAAENDSAQNNPRERAYYLKDIPFTAEQMEQSNALIMEGLLKGGIILKDKIDRPDAAERMLLCLVKDYPTYAQRDEAYYHLYLLYARKGDLATADGYLSRLKTELPASEWTKVLTDPYFREDAALGVHLEDSLYVATYDAMKAERNAEVLANESVSEHRFPEGANRDKFLFVAALAELNEGKPEQCLNRLHTLVEKFPKSGLAEMAGMIINGVKQGRRLKGGSFDMGNVWQRRLAVMADSDSINTRKLSNERNTEFSFMLVFMPDSVNENKLLYHVARYNFSSFPVRDFHIEMENDDPLRRLRVTGFRNYDEALTYARDLLAQDSLRRWMTKARPVIISKENLELLGTTVSYDDYLKFYNIHFAPLRIEHVDLVTQPVEVVTRKPEEPEPTPTQIDNMMDGVVIPMLEQAEPQKESPTTTVIPVETQQTKPAPGGTVIPVETEKPKQTPSGTVIPMEPEKPKQPTTPVFDDGGVTIPLE